MTQNKTGKTWNHIKDNSWILIPIGIGLIITGVFIHLIFREFLH